mgnify:CR=1 FL=1|tara:strand:+ start:56 stop:226 length:171 start_codon:yes stop_codon:yes gene_type:complete
MAGSLDHVLQPDGTYKWEVVEHKKEADEAPVVCPAPEPKETPKKVSKKKTDSPISE